MTFAVDKDHAVAAAAHRIASCVHAMLAERGMTACELKGRLAQFPEPKVSPEVVDAVLSATNSHQVTCRDLADIGWAIGFEWKFEVRRRQNPVSDETALDEPQEP